MLTSIERALKYASCLMANVECRRFGVGGGGVSYFGMMRLLLQATCPCSIGISFLWVEGGFGV